MKTKTPHGSCKDGCSNHCPGCHGPKKKTGIPVGLAKVAGRLRTGRNPLHQSKVPTK